MCEHDNNKRGKLPLLYLSPQISPKENSLYVENLNKSDSAPSRHPRLQRVIPLTQYVNMTVNVYSYRLFFTCKLSTGSNEGGQNQERTSRRHGVSR